MTRSIARRQTAQKPTGLRVNMMQSAWGRNGFVARAFEGADLAGVALGSEQLALVCQLLAKQRVHLFLGAVLSPDLAAPLLDLA
jgi:hypothetical protein